MGGGGSTYLHIYIHSCVHTNIHILKTERREDQFISISLCERPRFFSTIHSCVAAFVMVKQAPASRSSSSIFKLFSSSLTQRSQRQEQRENKQCEEAGEERRRRRRRRFHTRRRRRRLFHGIGSVWA